MTSPGYISSRWLKGIRDKYSVENWCRIACVSCSFNFDLIQIYYMRSFALSKSLKISFALTKYFIEDETKISISGRLAENKKDTYSYYNYTNFSFSGLCDVFPYMFGPAECCDYHNKRKI